MPTTRVKICGFTRPEDASQAAKLGADFFGLNFFAGPRKIDFTTGEKILSSLPDTDFAVGLFRMDNMRSPAPGDAESMVYCYNRLRIRQLYGLMEDIAVTSTRFDEEIDRRDVWLPMPVSSRESITPIRIQLQKMKLRVGAILLDTASKTVHGGTGKSFDWNWIAEARAAGELDGLPPLVLAGGLTPENVADAIRTVKPFAVDVSSGVEVPGKPGVKDPIKMRDFIQAARGAV